MRNEIILSGLSTDKLGLEIGPSHSPIVPKSKYNSHTLDHTDRDGLIEKYRNFPVDISKIEDVDYIFDGRPLEEITPHRYAYVIASHVIEHVPNFIGFLQSVENILESDGILSLAIPDKRQCFDALKSISSLPEIIDAYIYKHEKHPASVIFEAYQLAVKKSTGEISWAERTNYKQLEFCHSLEDAYEKMNDYINSDAYHDVHRWKFTPDSFQYILQCIIDLKLTNLKIIDISTTIGMEFFVKLKLAPCQKRSSANHLMGMLSKSLKTQYD